jgi:hypothetical protein
MHEYLSANSQPFVNKENEALAPQAAQWGAALMHLARWCSCVIPAAASNVVRFPESQVEVALRLARLYGFYVFPVNAKHRITSEGKHGLSVKAPLFEGWQERSANDPDQISALWAEYPDGAVAVDCEKSGLLVVDADRKPGKPDGLEAWRQLWNLLQFCSDEPSNQPPIVRTPNGGEHWYFRQPAGMAP